MATLLLAPLSDLWVSCWDEPKALRSVGSIGQLDEVSCERAACLERTDNGVEFLLLLGNGFEDNLVRLLLLYSSAILVKRYGSTHALLLLRTRMMNSCHGHDMRWSSYTALVRDGRRTVASTGIGAAL